jgi:hypothetical protein
MRMDRLASAIALRGMALVAVGAAFGLICGRLVTRALAGALPGIVPRELIEMALVIGVRRGST